ncbi:hypothetical protein [Alkalinema sp. FACHB-956]|uniref:hypothetical protein n=1 Tax=Alkalinema sp. FACHB-956 TaxID=2692768 RepID=UPI0016828A99|nr:hypothetical protein [Alkalinema sp. FACHB-956]MBD2326234.1 hypothetical protein [Alkalinema sp. FACHB-956]
MTAKTIAAHTLKLHDLKTRFNLQKIEAVDFFWEWLAQDDSLSEVEYGALDRLKRNYLTRATSSPIEITNYLCTVDRVGLSS